VGIFAIVLGQLALIGWLLHEYRRRRRSEAAANILSGQLIAAQEDERSRLGRELHDDITQRLGVLAIEAGRVLPKATDTAIRSAIQTLREGLSRLSKDVHALSYRLHSSILQDLGLREALRSECDQFTQTCSISVDLMMDDLPDRVPHELALCLFRIAQESLRNIERHASATRVSVRVQQFEGTLQLTVRDNGVGFNQAQAPVRASLGLASMRQRASLVGGKLNVESKPLRGTTISAWVPISKAITEPTA